MQEIFRQLNSAYQSNNFDMILNHQYGNYFLKLRSLSRAAILRQLANRISVDVNGINARQLFEYLFCRNIPEKTVDDFITEIYQHERAERINQEDNLYSQLFCLQVFNWGGFYQNAVEQTIVNNYVKKIFDYNQLLNSIDNDLTPRIRNYVLCSWYNHWTSILIEDMFKDHNDILPAIGLVKKVDFFWNNFPFDLKVTYFPEGFMVEKRKQKGLKTELIELKAFAKKLGVVFNHKATGDEIFNELILRITESPNQECKQFIEQFYQTRRDIINETIDNPEELIVWFYENQGVRRFDAANRFFIVLVDRNNLEESWKLKRNKEILSTQINDFLDANRTIDFNQCRINFNWEGNNYQSYATCLFIVRE